MSNLYIYDQGATLGCKDNKLVVMFSVEDFKVIPIENIDNIVMFGNIKVHTAFIKIMLSKGIHLTWLSKTGSYFGRLESTSNVNIHRQRLQFKMTEDKIFSLELSKNFIRGKILNQKTILIRANKTLKNNNLSFILRQMVINFRKIKEAKSIEELMGVEGFYSRMYYQGLNILLDSKYSFQKRTRRPPKDPFNAIISFGYTLLLYEIFTILLTKGLNPYAAFMHSDRHKHPALCSDLMEEWRPILVDSLAIALLNNNRIKKEDFDFSPETGAVFLNKDACKKFIENFEKRLRQEVSYIEEVPYKMSFRRIIEYQIMQLIKAMENGNTETYKPITIR